MVSWRIFYRSTVGGSAAPKRVVDGTMYLRMAVSTGHPASGDGAVQNTLPIGYWEPVSHPGTKRAFFLPTARIGKNRPHESPYTRLVIGSLFHTPARKGLFFAYSTYRQK